MLLTPSLRIQPLRSTGSAERFSSSAQSGKAPFSSRRQARFFIMTSLIRTVPNASGTGREGVPDVGAGSAGTVGASSPPQAHSTSSRLSASSRTHIFL